MSQQEADVARAFAQAVSSKAVQVTAMQARIWLFGGCAMDQDVGAYLDSITAIRGYMYKITGYDRDGFIRFMTPIVGDAVAVQAADIVEEGM
jgi:hypothetical protein